MQGYVRAVGAQGVFVTLGRGVDARIRLSNLSDTFVEDPAAAFVPGQLVQGTVLSLDPARWVSAAWTSACTCCTSPVRNAGAPLAGSSERIVQGMRISLDLAGWLPALGVELVQPMQAAILSLDPARWGVRPFM